MCAWQLLLQQPEGRTEEATLDDGDVRAGVEVQYRAGANLPKTKGMAPA